MITISIVQYGFYGILFVITLYTISSTLTSYPLFPLQTGSLDWSNAWLGATVVDYYGACLCFCGVVISSEPSWIVGILWVLGFCLLGSPVCCLWVLLWLWRGGGSLKLETKHRNSISDSGETSGLQTHADSTYA